MIEDQLLRAILANQSIIFGQCGGARDGETFTIRTQTGSIPARAYGPIAPGQCVAYRVGGQWLAVSVGMSQRLSQHVLEFQRRRTDVLIPVTPGVVHLFVASEAFQLNDTTWNSGRHHYWLVSGGNALKIFETNTYEPDAWESGAATPTDRIIPTTFGPVDENFYLMRVPRLWILTPTKFIVQILTRDYRNFNLPFPSNVIWTQIYTAIVENWQISIEHVQTQTSVGSLPTYPEELIPYLDWLYPDWGGLTSPPIVDEIIANYPEFEFDSQTCNANEGRIPTRVQYVFRPGDVMGGSGSYLNLATGETYTTGTPFGGSSTGFFAHLFDPLELNAIEREWQVFSPNGATTVLSPVTDYSLIGTNYHTFTDTQVLFADEQVPNVDNLYYIPQLRNGTFDAENELSGYFSVVQGRLTGYPDYSTIMFWLAAKSA